MSALRIISLLPAATEIVYALELEASLVGRSHTCDYPVAVQSLPVCTIDRRKDGLESEAEQAPEGNILSAALADYAVDLNKIKSLNPDVIITQSPPSNSLVNPADIESALKALLGKPVQVINFQPHRLVDIFDQIKQIAHQLQIDTAAEGLLETLADRLDLIRHKLKFIDQKPTVAAITALDPFTVAGDLAYDLIEIAGGASVFKPLSQDIRIKDWEAIRLADPQFIILMLAGHSISQTLLHMEKLMQWPGFGALTAIKSNHFYIADGKQYFNRPGQRVVDAAEIIAEILYPRQFIFGYEGEGWIRFES